MRNSVEIAHQIKKELDRIGMKPIELADRIGVDRSTVSRYLKGTRKISMEDIPKIAGALGLSPIDLLVEDRPSNLIEVSNQFVKIPILGTIACGDPITAVENISGYRNESPDNLPSGNIYYVEAKGNSMEPTIPDGSHVLIREQPEVEYGQIAAVLMNDSTEVTLKRVKRQGDLVMLVPDNSDHDTYIITKDNPARILGKAVRFTQDL